MGSGLCSMLKKLPWISPCESRKSIKLITVNGKVMKFKRPVYVKEIVEEYPHHGIFDFGSVKRSEIHVLTLPLDHNSELQTGQPYYLIPLSSADSRLEELKEIYSHPDIISASSIDGSRGLRVKLRMRKKDVPSFLNSNNIKVPENSVLKEELSLAMGQPGYNSGSGFISEWKPNLNTIAEINSEQAGN